MSEIRNLDVQPIEGAILILDDQERDGIRCLSVACHDFDHFKSLPAAVRYDGQTFGKTGWNSDTGFGYYRSDAKIAVGC